MNFVRHVRRLLPTLALFAIVPALLAGCSGKPDDKVIPRPIIGQRDADDIAQLLATTLAADHGGWYSTVKVMAETLAVPPHAAFTKGFGSPSLMSAFSFTKAGVFWNANVAYFHTDNSATATRDTATDNLEAYFRADQGVFTNANGCTGTYGYFNSSSPSDTNSWGMTVFGLNTASDTLEFSGVADDTSFAVVTSYLNSDQSRMWYFGGSTTNFMDFTIQIPKASLASSPYPVGALSEINWIIEADGLNGTSTSRTDIAKAILTEAQMTFAAYPAPFGLLIIQDSIGDAAYTYKYKVNLNTGLIERVP